MTNERYLRQQAVEGLASERLAGMRVAVVGAGAVGNEVVKNLVLLGVGAVDVHDHDRVELHNLTRSIFLREADVGAGKAAAVAERASAVDPNVRVRGIHGDAWRTLTLAGVARCDALVAAVDNFETRMRLSQLAQLAGTRFVNAAVDARHTAIEAYPFDRADAPACYECHLPASAYGRLAERYSCGWLRRSQYAEATVATTAITASIAGALAVEAALRSGTDGPARRVLIDTRTGSSTTCLLERNPACAGCATLVPRPRRVAARADWHQALAAHAPDAVHVLLAEPLIFACACVACGATREGAARVGWPAAAFDDRILRCAACGEQAVRVDMRAEATIDELVELCGASAPPVKFLLARAGETGAVCIDLEE